MEDTQRLTCSRCGNFVGWVDEQDEICAPCLTASLPEPLRGPLAVRSVVDGLFWLLTRIGPMAVLVTVAFETPGVFLFVAFPDLPPQVQGLYGLFTLVGELAVMVTAHEVLHGRTIGVLEAFGRGLSRYGAVFVTRWVANLLTLLWTLLLVIPGLYKVLQYCLAPSIAVFEDTSGAAAVDRSMERTRPHLLTLALTVGILFVSGIVWNLLVGAAYGVAAAPEVALLTPSSELDLVVTALGTFPSALFGLLATLALQLVYERTAVDARLAAAPDPSAERPRPAPAATSLDDRLDDELRRFDR